MPSGHYLTEGVKDAIWGATTRLELVGEARSGEEAVEMTGGLQADMVLMDVHMPGLGGIGAATARPDELPLAGTDAFADAVIRKGQLGPGRGQSRAAERSRSAGADTTAGLVVERGRRLLAREHAGFEQEKAERLAAALAPEPRTKSAVAA